jgi:RNA polymerase sigma-70 factor, ECF subfamily
MKRASVKETAESNAVDVLLIEMIREGNELAWKSLLDRHWSRVFAVALRIVGHHECAEDVRQDVFLQLIRRRELFNGVHGNVGGWLAASARNRSIDLLRQRRHMDSTHDRDYPSLEDFERVSEHKLMMAQLTPLMRELPERQQKLLHMSFFLGFSHSEIAKRTQYPLGTVKTIIRSALDQLRNRVAA